MAAGADLGCMGHLAET